jgi:Na+-transporting NADH:ubiquinone oxidoreductase subunit NqrB
MKTPSTLTCVLTILCITLVCEAALAITIGVSGSMIIRVLLTIGLFAMLLSGAKVVRHVLGALYLMGGLSGLVFAIPLFQRQATAGLLVLIVGAFGAASGVYFFRSQTLKALSSSSPLNS